MAEKKYSSKRISTIILKTNNSFIQYIGTEIRHQMLHIFESGNTINSGRVIPYKEITKQKEIYIIEKIISTSFQGCVLNHYLS